MGLGIDPKNDYAFKCLFGSERHTSILIHLLNAVLRPPSDRRVVGVQILNPITEPVTLDDKLAVLDLKARDQSGRRFNVEMQMVLHPALRSRFLYYWARTYSSQLVAGDDYGRLAPVVSICFLDALLFPETDAFHLPFRLLDPATNLVLSDDLAIHIFQLPNFVKTEDELRDELDCWLFFLNNGEELDPAHIPQPLRVPEFQEALEIMQTLTQDEIERQRYESREMARRDALSWEREIERAHQKAEHAEQKLEHAEQEAVKALIGQITLCEQLLHRPTPPEDELRRLSLDELQGLGAQLRRELIG